VLFPIARGPVKLSGALIEIDETDGRALSIERIAHVYEPPPPAPVVTAAAASKAE
jgi:hypothetical protein